MDFGDAIKHLRKGKRLTRDGWNGRSGLRMWVALQRPDAQSKMTLPYIYVTTVDGGSVPWTASQTDMLADDWRVVTE